jgi:class 3 adenylate cyclase/tetratricopeptide (TPR) repeat protein
MTELASRRLRPFVVGLVVDWLQTAPASRHRRVPGSLAFVDISGFTKLTERLATKGKVGAEELSDLLDSTFAELLEVAYSYGATLVKWGGDAVLLLFEGDEHALLACRAAYEMRLAMRRIGLLRTSVGTVRLRMSVGVHSGEVDFFLVGDRHRELLVTGPVASATAEMEAIAEAGEVVVSPTTAALLPSRCRGAAKGDGVLLRSAPAVDPRCRFRAAPPDTLDLGDCLDPVVRDHLVVGGIEGEHRQVAVAFVEIGGVDALLLEQGPGAVAGALHDLIARVQHACARHRVTFWETDISRDGFKVMLVAGVPAGSGHDEEGLLRAGRAVLDGYAGPLRVRIGANCGRVFSGEFGPAFRRTLSVKGDAVNLAARVMGRAGPGRLVATDTLLRRAGVQVEGTSLEPFLVKGKRHPVHATDVARVTRIATMADADIAFVGREQELDAVLSLGRGAAVRIVGDAGIGKSRLVDEALGRLGPAMRVVRSFADDYESSTPYFLFRRLLRLACGLDADCDAETAVRQLLRRLTAGESDLVEWLPLLAIPFGVQLAETPQTASVHEEFRRERIAALTIQLLSLVCSSPTVFVVDDMHYADDASVGLLDRLSAESSSRPWLVVLTGRRMPSAAGPGANVLALGPLTREQTESIVVAAAGETALASRTLSAVVDRAEGNPLFAQELSRAWTGLDDGEGLPTSLEELFAARLDELAPVDRSVLRAAAVLGTRFDEDVLRALLDRPLPDTTWNVLARFVVADGAGVRRFATALARDAAYEGLPFRRRRALHGRAADILAARGGADQAETLSWHYDAAQRFPEAWAHSVLAGDRARRVYANVEAVTFYGRAIRSARHLPGLAPTELAHVAEALGDSYARLAELDAAASAYRQARRHLAASDHLARARLAVSTALVTARAGATDRSLRWLSYADRELRDETTETTAAAAGELRARALVERAFLSHTRGRERIAAVLCSRAIELAESVGADAVLGRALHLLDLVELAAGGAGDDARVQRALALFEKSDDLPRQAGAWNHLGIRAYYAGAWDLAVDRYERARAAHLRSGDEWSAAIASANIGEILVDQGRLTEAQPLVVHALRVWRGSGTPSDVGFGAALLGRLCVRAGRVAEGAQLLDEAATAYASKEQRFELVDVGLRVGEMLVLQGAGDAALRHLDGVESALHEALHAAGVIAAGAALPESSEFAASLWRLRGYAAAQSGDDAGARADLARSLEAARRRGSPHEVAQSLDALLWLSPNDRQDMLAERDALRGRLGVVWAPAVPGAAVLSTSSSAGRRERARTG